MDINLGRLGFADQGLYSPGLAYVKRDVVTYLGSTYRCVANTAPGQDPVTYPASWVLMAKGTSTVYTAKGDMITFDGANLTRLGIGTQGQTLGVNNGMPIWMAPQARPGTVAAALAYNPNGTSCSYAGLPVIMSDGSVKMWGQSSNYCVGDMSNSNVINPQPVSFDPNNPPTFPIVQVATCYMTNYALDSAGRVFAWGYNSYGQLGQGDTTNRAIATQINWFVQQGVQIAAIIVAREGGVSASNGSAWFLTTTGTVYGVGYNAYGQLGNGTTSNSSLPARCGTISGIAKVFVGGMDMASVFAIDTGNKLWAWGYNAYGQLGLGDATNRSTPMQVPNITNAKKVCCTNGYAGPYVTDTAVLCTDGSIYVCGWNGQGALGMGDTTTRYGFTKIPIATFTPADIELYGGYYDSLWVIDTVGHLWACGYNGYGQLGTGDTTNRSSLVQIGSGQPWDGKAVRLKAGGGQCASSQYVFAVLMDSTTKLWSAGYNGSGQLAVGDTSQRATFTRVLGPRPTEQMGVIDYTTGGYSSSGRLWVLSADGRLWGAGDNTGYSLGTQCNNNRWEGRLSDVDF
ncbi:MAG: hypothetical protein Q7R40_00210 [Phaeospirillum sp.]|nr:hypothetical protein [Phaeospirillum sp.]